MSTHGKPKVTLAGTDYSDQIEQVDLGQGQQEFDRSPLNADGVHKCFGLKTDSIVLQVADDASDTLTKYFNNNRGSSVAIVVQTNKDDVSDGKWTGNVLIPGTNHSLRAGGEKKYSITLPVETGKLTYAES